MFFFFFQAEDGIRDYKVTGVQTCALPISGLRAEECRVIADSQSDELPSRLVPRWPETVGNPSQDCILVLAFPRHGVVKGLQSLRGRQYSSRCEFGPLQRGGQNRGTSPLTICTLYSWTGDRFTQPDLQSTKNRVDAELYRI